MLTLQSHMRTGPLSPSLGGGRLTELEEGDVVGVAGCAWPLLTAESLQTGHRHSSPFHGPPPRQQDP